MRVPYILKSSTLSVFSKSVLVQILLVSTSGILVKRESTSNASHKKFHNFVLNNFLSKGK